MKQARFFSCLFDLRPLMPLQRNSRFVGCFIEWRLPSTMDWVNEARFFLACFLEVACQIMTKMPQ